MKLSELINEMTEVFEEYGDMKVVVMRSGRMYSEIETVVDDELGLYYVEAYREDE